MHRHRTLVQNILAAVGSAFFARALKFLLLLSAARIFGAEDYGRLSYIMVIAMFIAIAMDIGVSRFVVQQLAKDETRSAELLGHNILLNFLLGTLLVSGMMFYFHMHDPRPDMAWIALLLGCASMIDCIAGSFAAIFQARQKMVYPSMLISGANFLMTLLGFLLLFLFPNLLLFACYLLAGALVRLALSWRISNKRFVKPDFAFKRSTFFWLIGGGLPFSLSSVFVFIYYQISVIFLEHYHGSETVGYYVAPFRLIEAPLSISSTIVLALFPAVAHLASSNLEEVQKLVSQAFKLALIFILPFAIVAGVHADFLIRLAYGDAFAPSIPVLQIMVLALAIIFPCTMIGSSLRAMGHQRLTMLTAAAGSLINILVNLLLIPRYGMIGAAWTSVITEGFILCCYLLLTRGKMGGVPMGRDTALVLLLNALLLGFCLATAHWNVFLSTAIAAICYLMVLEWTGLFRLRQLNALLRRQNHA